MHAKPIDQALDDPVDGRKHHLFLRREVDVDGPLADAGRLGDVVHRRLRVAEDANQAFGGVKDQSRAPARSKWSSSWQMQYCTIWVFRARENRARELSEDVRSRRQQPVGEHHLEVK